MTIGFIFWLLMLLSVLFGFFGLYNWPQHRPWFGGSLMIFILLFLLGWKTFGFIIQG